MRWLVALVSVTGCGRIAFDARPEVRDAAIDAPLVCPPGYTKDGDGCYRTGTGTATWLAAEQACEADAVGAHLVVIGDAAEAAIVDKYRPSSMDFAWIGATDQAVEGRYRTVVNREMTYLAWAPGEPEGAGEDCLLMGPNQEIADGVCGTADDYICEYDGIPPSTAAYGVCPNGYTFFEIGCYRFVDGGAMGIDFFGAEADCEDDGPGSHLVAIDDANEASIVDTFVPSSIADHFIGATDFVTEGVYLTVLNEPLEYLVFRANEPDGGTNENCLLMNDAAELGDKECDVDEDYVCEYDGRTAVPASWGQ